MRKFMVFCLTTVGALTMVSMVAAAGAAGLYYWHGEDGCSSLPQKVRIVTEQNGHTSVYDLSPKSHADRRCGRDGACAPTIEVEPAAPTAVPAPAPAGAAGPPPALAAEASPTSDEILELKARLAAALQRIAELEAQRRASPEAPATPQSPVPADADKSADF